jgi:tRNA G18 (ribose-2'-O)-methylase SpoU
MKWKESVMKLFRILIFSGNSQLGTKHSLNVSVCGGIVMWEFAKAKNKTAYV